MSPIITCARCAKEKEHKARGLCPACYQNWLYNQRIERFRARQREYYWAHRDERLTYNQHYREKNRERIAAQMRPYSLRWAKENPEKHAAKKARRRARKKSLLHTLTGEQAERLLAIGQATYPGQKLHLDHVVPLSGGGGTTRANMHAIPAQLNFGKGGRLPGQAYKQEMLW